ncbi:3-beta hydroxysteroid dehydrogenase/isomerase domain-containing protein [Madurella fahalii]|uniref:3-beta hydroxysteroid dehydrogenase/isomerase domain-containing protein n=1 Tax=Madurella fahalii TaxID=1157608 RepID=A0ABQ0FZG7_9PEZI
MAGILATLGAIAAVIIFWLYRINCAFKAVPEEVARASPRRWTKDEIRETYERLKRKPLDFLKETPPCLERRYVVVGGSGLVGGDLVLQLLRRGQSPESIRIVDFSPLNRPDMLEAAAGCDFVKADITSRASVEAAFSKPWPASVAKKPMTVFHTAAGIRPQERSPLLYHRISRVNRDGAVNVLEAAQAAGADIFIATSSASVSIVPPNFWIWPWQSVPDRYVQIADEKDFDAPIREHHLFFSNYGRSKAEAERAVCGANREGFRTGTIRPGNPIYGQKTDPVLGTLLRDGSSASWIPHIVQNFVNSRNVSLAHLQFEAALAQTDKAMPRCAGRTFTVTDAGPPPAFADAYNAVMQLSATPLTMSYPAPVLLYLVAHATEAWCLLLARLPFLTTWLGLREPTGPMHFLQPSVFSVSVHTLVDDSAAKRSVADGGIAYRPGCTTLEGVCQQLVEWNEEVETGKAKGVEGGVEGEGKVAKAGLVAKGVAA